MIKNQYNQVPNLTQNTAWESDITQENITYKRAKKLALSQQVTTRLRLTDETSWHTRNIYIKKDHKRSTTLEQSVKIILLEGLN